MKVLMKVEEIRTERLLLRPWRDDDLPAYAALNADPHVMEHFPSVLTREESDLSAGRLRVAMEQQGFGLWAVEVPGVASFIGFIGLHVPSFEAHFMPAIEIGWRLAHEHWGKGYAPEGAKASLDAAFGQLGLAEVVAMTVPRNARSRRVMGKLGMTYDPSADFDHPKIAEGHPLQRHVLYRIKASERGRMSD